MSNALHLEAAAEGLHAEARGLRDLERRALEIEAESKILQTRVHDLECLAERVRRRAELDDPSPAALIRRADHLEGEAHKLEAVAAVRRDHEARQAREAQKSDDAAEASEQVAESIRVDGLISQALTRTVFFDGSPWPHGIPVPHLTKSLANELRRVGLAYQAEALEEHDAGDSNEWRPLVERFASELRGAGLAGAAERVERHYFGDECGGT